MTADVSLSFSQSNGFGPPDPQALGFSAPPAAGLNPYYSHYGPPVDPYVDASRSGGMGGLMWGGGPGGMGGGVMDATMAMGGGVVGYGGTGAGADMEPIGGGLGGGELWFGVVVGACLGGFVGVFDIDRWE